MKLVRFSLHHSRARRFLAGVVLLLAALAVSVPGVARADEQLRGAQVHSLWPGSSIEDSERELDMLADAGANAVRIDVSWSSMETDGKGNYSPWYLEKADRIFKHANDRGLKVVAVFWGTPCWASSA